MARTSQRLIHYNTSGKNAPSVSNLYLGEIAVQYNDDEPKLYIKTASGEIAQFTDKVYQNETYIRTVNSTGPDENGNVEVAGGGEVPIIQKGTSDTTFTIEPNKVYVWDQVTSLDISLATPTSTNIVNHYFFQFTSGPTATSLSLPADVIYMGDSTIVASRIYQCSILNGIAKLGGATIVIINPIVDFNVSTAIGTTVSSNTGTKTYDVTDDQGNTVTFSVVGGGSSWSVTSGSYSYTINGTDYSSTYQIYFGGAGSTSARNIQVPVTGPCTIYIAARQSGNTSRTVNAYVGTSSVGSFTTSSSSSVTVGTINYTGTGGTLTIYASGACYFYHVEIDYNV